MSTFMLRVVVMSTFILGVVVMSTFMLEEVVMSTLNSVYLIGRHVLSTLLVPIGQGVQEYPPSILVQISAGPQQSPYLQRLLPIIVRH